MAATYHGTTGWTALNAAGDRQYADFDFWAIRPVGATHAWTRVAGYETRSGTLSRQPIHVEPRRANEEDDGRATFSAVPPPARPPDRRPSRRCFPDGGVRLMNRSWRLLRNLWRKPVMPDLSDALAEGTRSTPDGTSVTRSLHPLGDLVLPTGQIVASDPFIADDLPYTRGVAPGRYPVLVNVARINTDSRVAYAILRFSGQRPVRWEMALYPGHDPATPGENEFFGYGVDSGTGCFIDAGAVRILVERSTTDNGYDQDLADLMAETYVHTWSWVDYVLDPDTGANVIAFSSGWGDGVYPSFWGLDETGAPVCLVTDFRVFWPFGEG